MWAMLDFKSVTPSISKKNILKRIFRLPKFHKPSLPNISLRYKIVSAIFVLGAIITAAIYFLPINYSGLNGIPNVAQADSQDANAQVLLNKQFSLPIYGEDGKKTENSLKISAVNVERTNKILVNGKPASAKSGKDFLLINIEIENSTKDKLNVRPVDFFRLLGSQDKSYAADVHNDVVKAEPLSIRKTRVGWVVDENQHKFKFLIGEINGEKQTIEVNI